MIACKPVIRISLISMRSLLKIALIVSKIIEDIDSKHNFKNERSKILQQSKAEQSFVFCFFFKNEHTEIQKEIK